MKFTEILEELKKGDKVTREEWKKVKTYRYKYIKLEHGDCVAYLKDDSVRHKGEELTTWVGCVFSCADFTAEDWKIYQENPTQMWKPEDGDKYYYITSCGAVDIDYFYNNNYDDECRIRIGNVFKTKEKALHMVEKIKTINKLKELSNINFGNDINELKYSIGYDVDNKKVCPTMNRFTRIIPFEVYFATRKDCVNAIDRIGEDNLKKYYFDIAEVEEDK